MSLTLLRPPQSIPLSTAISLQPQQATRQKKNPSTKSPQTASLNNLWLQTIHNNTRTMSAKSTVLLECAKASDGATMEAEALLLCLASRMQALEDVSNQQSADTAQWLLIFAGALVFMMQTGFAVGVFEALHYNCFSYLTRPIHDAVILLTRRPLLFGLPDALRGVRSKEEPPKHHAQEHFRCLWCCSWLLHGRLCSGFWWQRRRAHVHVRRIDGFSHDKRQY